MSDRGFIPPTEPPEFEPLKIPPIEPEKNIKEEFSDKKKFEDTKKKTLFSASLFLIMKQCINKLLPKRERHGESYEEGTALTKHLKIFKDHLIRLKTRDESQNSHFAQELTDAWNKILIDYEIILKSEGELSLVKKPLRTLIHEIDAYPPKEEHSLGFYLTHYAGEKWLPFPFMAILSHLHENYLKKQEAGDLQHLLERIDDILKLLIPKIP